VRSSSSSSSSSSVAAAAEEGGRLRALAGIRCRHGDHVGGSPDRARLPGRCSRPLQRPRRRSDLEGWEGAVAVAAAVAAAAVAAAAAALRLASLQPPTTSIWRSNHRSCHHRRSSYRTLSGR
jgi:hypothetical protein